MSTDESQLSTLIVDFCHRIVDDYRDISSKMRKLHPEWSAQDLAGNLMEFGRGQISGIDHPSESDLNFMTKYVGCLNWDNSEVALFVAYAGGCIMGLVQSKQLSGSDFSSALQISANFALTELKQKDRPTPIRR